MQARATQMAHWTLGITGVAALAVIVSLTLEFAGHDVPVHVYIAVTSTGAASGVGWVAATCTRWILQQVADRNAKATEVVNCLREIRKAMADFVDSVEEYGDQRAIATRLDDLRALSEKSDGPTGRIVTQLRRPHVRRDTSA